MADTVPKSYVNPSSLSAGAAAEQAAERKTTKYIHLMDRYTFVPIAVETLGPINQEGADFLAHLGRLISGVTGDSREHSFLLQRISMAIQRFNAVCFKGTFAPTSASYATTEN